MILFPTATVRERTIFSFYAQRVDFRSSPLGRRYFLLLDPKFPDRLTRSGYHRTVQFLQYLFQQYARCGLSLSLDREIAILV